MGELIVPYGVSANPVFRVPTQIGGVREGDVNVKTRNLTKDEGKYLHSGRRREISSVVVFVERGFTEIKR